jgi:NADH-quinone oxidoreductase subunit M
MSITASRPGALFIWFGFSTSAITRSKSRPTAAWRRVAPHLTTIFLITTLASIGLPLLNNFIGEFLIPAGAAIANFNWAVGAGVA